MKSIELLLEEHRAIERMLSVLESAAVRLHGGGDVPRPVADELFEFFERFGDAGHHQKEEDLLFPVLAAHGLGPETSPIGALAAQHEVGRAFLGDLRRTFRRIERGDSAAREDFATLAREYADMLREHIRIEDHYFVEFASRVMTPAEDDELARAIVGPRARFPARDRQRYMDMTARHEEIAAAW